LKKQEVEKKRTYLDVVSILLFMCYITIYFLDRWNNNNNLRNHIQVEDLEFELGSCCLT